MPEVREGPGPSRRWPRSRQALFVAKTREVVIMGGVEEWEKDRGGWGTNGRRRAARVQVGPRRVDINPEKNNAPPEDGDQTHTGCV